MRASPANILVALGPLHVWFFFVAQRKQMSQVTVVKNWLQQIK